MHRLLVFYPWPDDPDAFRRYFLEVHMPLAAKIPGALRRGYSFEPSVRGDFDCFCVFEADYASEAEMTAALATPEAQAAGRDIANYSPQPPRTLVYELAVIQRQL